LGCNHAQNNQSDGSYGFEDRHGCWQHLRQHPLCRLGVLTPNE
jgi:hypothetical protein